MKKTDMMKEMRHEMYRAAVELLGTGYVPSYYETAASGFVGVAEAHIEELVKALKEWADLAEHLKLSTEKHRARTAALVEAYTQK